MRVPRKVTMQPMGMPTRNLKFEIAFLAWRMAGFLAGDRRQFGDRTFEHLWAPAPPRRRPC